MNHVSFDKLSWVLLAVYPTLKIHSISIHTKRLMSLKVTKGSNIDDDMCHRRYKRILFYEISLLLDKPHHQSSDLPAHMIFYSGYESF
jgi:hypothetical protein